MEQINPTYGIPFLAAIVMAIVWVASGFYYLSKMTALLAYLHDNKPEHGPDLQNAFHVSGGPRGGGESFDTTAIRYVFSDLDNDDVVVCRFRRSIKTIVYLWLFLLVGLILDLGILSIFASSH